MIDHFSADAPLPKTLQPRPVRGHMASGCGCRTLGRLQGGRLRAEKANEYYDSRGDRAAKARRKCEWMMVSTSMPRGDLNGGTAADAVNADGRLDRPCLQAAHGQGQLRGA